MGIFTQFPESFYLRQSPKFDAADTEFGPDIARTMAWAAQLAYETNDPEKLGRVLASWGWTLRGVYAGFVSSVLPLTSAKGFVARRDGVSVVVFSGTDPLNLADWLLDFSIGRNADGIHDGFEAGVDAVWSSIISFLEQGGAAAGHKIFVVGHSLGAALAVVATYRLASATARYRIGGVYAFGMPRVGDEEFAAKYRAAEVGSLGQRTFRFIHGVDIVPQVPPSQAPFGFRHVGRPLTCGHGSCFDLAQLDRDEPEAIPSGQAVLVELARSLNLGTARRDLPEFPGNGAAALVIDRLPPLVRDHLMDRYLLALGAL